MLISFIEILIGRDYAQTGKHFFYILCRAGEKFYTSCGYSSCTTINSSNVSSESGVVITLVTTAFSGPLWHHSVNCRNCSSLPVAIISTLPSLVYFTQPVIPSLSAWSFAV